MRGRQAPRRAASPRWRSLSASGVAAALAAVTLGAFALGTGPAAAATESAQLTLTGVSDSKNPAGGSSIDVRPGDSVRLSASAAPTSAAKDLAGQVGLNSVLGTLTGSTTFQVEADFSHLPGGTAKTVLGGNATRTFRFTRLGTYAFTWQAQQVRVVTIPGIPGVTPTKTVTKVTTVSFDGNALKKYGIAVNGSNTYVGQIVVATKPRQGGLGAQVPTVKAHPKVGPVQLPTVTVPGQRLPTVRVSVPDLPTSLPTGRTTAGGSRTGKGSGGSTHAPSRSSTGPGYVPGKNGPLPVRTQIVGGGAGGAGTSGGGQAVLTDNGGTIGGNPRHAARSAGGAAPADGTKGPRTVDLAQQNTTPSAGLPVVLALLAVAMLAAVAAGYLRLRITRKAG